MFGMFRGMTPFLLASERQGFGPGDPFGEDFPLGRSRGRGRGRGRGWGDEKRTRRGDIKYILLSLLVERPRHGYELIKEMETRQGGFYRLSPGSVYPTLQMLEEGGYLTSEPIDGKRVYTISGTGKQLLAQRRQQIQSEDALDPSGAPIAGKTPELIELRNTAFELGSAIMQVARSGNSKQVCQVREVLLRVKREIYAILAQEP